MKSKELSVDLRDKIVSRHKSGEGYRKNSAALNVPMSTVASIIRKWKKFETTRTLPRAGRPSKECSQDLDWTDKRIAWTYKNQFSNSQKVSYLEYRTLNQIFVGRCGLSLFSGKADNFFPQLVEVKLQHKALYNGLESEHWWVLSNSCYSVFGKELPPQYSGCAYAVA
ncbi:hypothetical protein NFI96_002041 [Prochilodus magdalenae]|nr:hypothetical protein NFI96_002041 [Prochilodus magdalenae]